MPELLPLQKQKQEEYAIINGVRDMDQKMMISNLAVDNEESLIVHTRRRIVVKNSLCSTNQGRITL